jgi:hypothetical protein
MAESLKWEYRVEIAGSTLSTMKNDALEELLNGWGEEGWEVISVFHLPNSNKMRLIAKRPLSLTSRRRRSWPSG